MSLSVKKKCSGDRLGGQKTCDDIGMPVLAEIRIRYPRT